VAQDGTSSKTINLLFQYVLNMARYDLSYNVRDRARFLKGLVYGQQKAGQENVELDSSENENGLLDANDNNGSEIENEPLQGGGFEYSDKALNLSEHVRKILLSEKEAPIQENPSHGKNNYDRKP